MRRVALLAVMGLVPVALAGQASPWLDRPSSQSFSVEAWRPSLKSPGSPTSAAFFVSGRLRLSGTTAAVAELPIATSSSGPTVTGNPYLGVEYRPGEPTTWYDIGLRPSSLTTSSISSASAAVADWTRLEAWTPQTFSLAAHVNWQSADHGTATIIRFGPSFILPSSSGTGSGSTLLADYAVLGAWLSPGVSFRAGATGRMIVSGSGGDVNDRTQVSLGASVAFRAGPIEPAIGVQVPVVGSFVKANLDHVVTLSVTLIR